MARHTRPARFRQPSRSRAGTKFQRQKLRRPTAFQKAGSAARKLAGAVVRRSPTAVIVGAAAKRTAAVLRIARIKKFGTKVRGKVRHRRK